MDLRALAAWAVLSILSTGCWGSIDGSSGTEGTGGGGTDTPGGQAGSGGAQQAAPSDPGTVVLRRLNRTEYNNTVRDLLETTLQVEGSLPEDVELDGFDTVGEALTLSPDYVRSYSKTATLLVEELFRADPASERRKRILSCNVTDGGLPCARKMLKPFARQAWRRPVTDAEVETLLLPLAVAQQNALPVSDGLQGAFEAVLMSPHFIFRVELDPTPGAHRLNDHELATRLSYFLWSTMPDATLAAAADAGRLQQDGEFGAQLERMLSDPRANRLSQTFAARWLEVQHLEQHEVNPTRFPGYRPRLALSMKAEVDRFFQEFLRTGLPITDMLSARFTFADPLLAAHYDLPAPAMGIQRVDLGPAPRAGLLTMGAILMTTSYPESTSPVIRGNYVLDRLMCAAVPPPLDPVSAIDQTPGMATTRRQRLEAHRSNPACAGCHRLMDPIGLGMENYDGIGKYRTTEDKLPIDASGQLADGTSFSGALELAAILARDPRFARCFAQKLTTFALGRRPILPPDAAWIDHLSGTARGGSGAVRAFIHALVMSEAFRSRRAGTAP